ncbi:MAG: hypothetical protein HeimC3_07800 [Candidatus Heimdallarchaeota archaeon LC_3]|nr:MAG: hypothetical protein HeimC3_07800 [Candidatus Heimdallarchaeota archaeon LC_3]
MDIFQIIRIISPLTFIIAVLFLVKKNISSRKQYSGKELWLYLTIALGLLALSMAAYSITPFVAKDQYLLAELSLGGTLILIMIGMVFYVEYWHTLYKKIPWISKLF